MNMSYLAAAVWLVTTACLDALPVSALYSRGYTVIPEPQRVELKGADFEFSNAWHIEAGPHVSAGDVAVESLEERIRQTNYIFPVGPSI